MESVAFKLFDHRPLRARQSAEVTTDLICDKHPRSVYARPGIDPRRFGGDLGRARLWDCGGRRWEHGSRLRRFSACAHGAVRHDAPIGVRLADIAGPDGGGQTVLGAI